MHPNILLTENGRSEQCVVVRVHGIERERETTISQTDGETVTVRITLTKDAIVSYKRRSENINPRFDGEALLCQIDEGNLNILLLYRSKECQGLTADVAVATE